MASGIKERFLRMAIPPGADYVRYRFHVRGEEDEDLFELSIECGSRFGSVGTSGPLNDSTHDAVEVGAQAILDYLETQNPGGNVLATREYRGAVLEDMDPWPSS